MTLDELDLQNENFIIAVYKRAAKDYVDAIITGNIKEQNSIRRFFEDADYGISEKTRRFIANQLPEEINIARNVITSFLASDSEELYLNQRKVVIWILERLANLRYYSECKVINKRSIIGWSDVYYLVKRQQKRH